MLRIREQYRHLNQVGCLYPVEQLQSLCDQAQDPDELDAVLYHLFQYDVEDTFQYMHIAEQVRQYFQGEEDNNDNCG